MPQQDEFEPAGDSGRCGEPGDTPLCDRCRARPAYGGQKSSPAPPLSQLVLRQIAAAFAYPRVHRMRRSRDARGKWRAIQWRNRQAPTKHKWHRSDGNGQTDTEQQPRCHPSTRNATAEGMTKNAMRRKPAAKRVRKTAAISSRVPIALERAGSSAAETDILKRLTGSMEITWP